MLNNIQKWNNIIIKNAIIKSIFYIYLIIYLIIYIVSYYNEFRIDWLIMLFICSILWVIGNKLEKYSTLSYNVI